MDGRPTWTDCDEAGDYVVPNVLSPRDLVFRPDNMDGTVPHTYRPEGSQTSTRYDATVLLASMRLVKWYLTQVYAFKRFKQRCEGCLSLLCSAHQVKRRFGW